ncbi:MAG: sugar transferase [Polyangiaceae bacterium]|jgi:lipopolysaccharide/colanic/teichoic acid biosynthesis glycosyltransferase|nr:sugar transferase [Polyangiaceae bacterium]
MPPRSVTVTKRLIDIAAASVGLALTLPLYPAIAFAIKLDSKGPIFFRQKRAGRLLAREPNDPDPTPHCEEFTLVKFRTMGVDAEKQTGAVLAEKNDPRVTRVGKFLRKTRLDELPQLMNVLRGDMSLVGPRPERPELLRNFALAIPFFEERMRDVKPGLTGMAQVSLGYTGSIPDESALAAFKETLQNPFKLEEADGALADDLRAKLLYDLAYTASLERFSAYLRTELGVILKTPLVMISSSGH